MKAETNSTPENIRVTPENQQQVRLRILEGQYSQVTKALQECRKEIQLTNYEPVLQHALDPETVDRETDVDILLNDAFLFEGECRNRGEYVKGILSVAYILDSQAEKIDVSIAQGLAKSLRNCAEGMMRYLKTVDELEGMPKAVTPREKK